MAAYRFRKCPSCETEMAAGELISLTMGANWGKHGYASRKCPYCGYVGQTEEFTITRDLRNGNPFSVTPKGELDLAKIIKSKK